MQENIYIDFIAKESAEMLRELRKLTQVMERIEAWSRGTKYGTVPQGHVQAMEGWMLSVVESYVRMTRLANGSVAAANAVARMKTLAEKKIDWERG
ncbi:MAG: hypothetical protein JNK48_07620 [Bryobacterales bacterium]|nr:hypothetical protein [Bryobacterales bacterium]